MATQATRMDQRIYKDEETGKWMIVLPNNKRVPYPIGDQNEQSISGKDINQMFSYKFPDMPFLNIGKNKVKTTLGEGSICRYVSKDGVVTFKRGLTKDACNNLSENALFTEEPWEPHAMPTGDTRGMALPWSEGKDLTLDLEKRQAYRDNLWQQMGEEDLIRQDAAFGRNQGLNRNIFEQDGQKRLQTYSPQREGYDYSPGTKRHQEMLARTAANAKTNAPYGKMRGGYYDLEPGTKEYQASLLESPEASFADYVSEMSPNRAGGSGFQPVPYYQHPAKPTYNVGGTVHEGGALDYSGAINDFPSKQEFEKRMIAAVGPNWKEIVDSETLDYYNTLPTQFTAGATYRGSDEYAEKPGERAQYMNRQNLWNTMEEERAPGIGLANYVPPVNLEQREDDQNLFDEAKRQREFADWYKIKEMEVLGRENYGEEDAAFDAAGYPNFIMGDDGTFPGKAVQPTKDDFRLDAAADVLVDNLEKAQIDGVEVADGEPWWTTPDEELNKIIGDSAFGEWLTSMEEYGGNWTKDFIKGLKKNYDNQEWLMLAGKLWLGGKGIKWGGKLLWSLVPFKKGSKLTPNLIKVVIAGETYQIATDLDSDVPLFEQIQIKVNEIMSGGAAGGPEVVEEDGKGTEDVTVTEDVTTKITPIDAINDPTLWSQITTNNASGTTGDTGLLNTGTGTAQQQGYSGNIGDMFSNLWNPNPETMDYWYKTREGDIPGNNRMREAMARLAYMGLYPEDRGDDPYRQLSDDRIAYTNNLLDAASSQATLSATAANRQYNQWKNMLPSQNELAAQLVKQKGWTDFFTSQDDLDAQADKMAGSLLRQFHGLMAKGIAPTPENLKVANFLEKNGIDATAESVNYALQNGVMEAMQGAGDDDDGGNTQTAVGAVQSMKSMISNAASAFTQ